MKIEQAIKDKNHNQFCTELKQIERLSRSTRYTREYEEACISLRKLIAREGLVHKQADLHNPKLLMAAANQAAARYFRKI